MPTYIGNTEIRRSEVLALIAQEVKIAPQGHQEPFGAFARRIRKEFESDEDASKVAEYCLAKWIGRERNDIGPTRPLARSTPRVEKVQMLNEQEELDTRVEAKAEADNIGETAVPETDEDVTEIGVTDPVKSEEEPVVEEKSSQSITPFDEGVGAACQELAGKPLIPNPYEEHSLIAGEWQRGYDSVAYPQE
ncbi:MAG: hypothetical protein ACO3PR_00050 [Limisphaerales bacterium]